MGLWELHKIEKERLEREKLPILQTKIKQTKNTPQNCASLNSSCAMPCGWGGSSEGKGDKFGTQCDSHLSRIGLLPISAFRNFKQLLAYFVYCL